MTVPLVRKTLVSFVTATGTVNPQNTISVGTQVSGTISSIVADYNDRVRKGQVLARIDPTLLQAALEQALGTLSQARSQWQAARADAGAATSNSLAAYASADAIAQNVGVARAATIAARANVEKTKAGLTLASLALERDRELVRTGYIAQSQYDTDSSGKVAASAALSSAVVTSRQAAMQLTAARNQATAGAAQGDASASQATGLRQAAEADLGAISTATALVHQASINLDHTVITSPVDGTVIARNVSVGQTVAASFQTPTLYTIAQDLTKMEIDVAVGEPDIGIVSVGDTVDFSVLAFPNVQFHGVVAQVRENPTTIANVVTYDTVVYANNAGGRLRPGMTATAQVNVAKAPDALVVPIAALSVSSAGRGAASSQASTKTAWGNAVSPGSAPPTVGSLARVGVVERGVLRDVPVKVLLVTAGEVAIAPASEALAPGTPIAVAVAVAAAH